MFGVKSRTHRPAGGIPAANKSLLLHLNSLPFTDSGNYAYSITNVGVTRETSIVKLGTGSGAFNGSTMLSVPNGQLNTFGAGDFTIELFVNFSSIRTVPVAGWPAMLLIDNVSSNAGTDRGWGLAACDTTNGSSNGLQFNWSENGNSTFGVTVDFAWTVGQWYHVAACRQSGVLRFFVDGVKIGTDKAVAGTIYTNSKPTGIGDFQEGSWAGSWGFHGYMDEIRVIKGLALYTTNFTPPIGEYA